MKNIITRLMNWCYRFCKGPAIMVVVVMIGSCKSPVSGERIVAVTENKTNCTYYTDNWVDCAGIVGDCNLYKVGDILWLSNKPDSVKSITKP